MEHRFVPGASPPHAERRRAGDATPGSETLCRTIVDRAAVGMVQIDLDCRITLANPHFGLIVGREPASLTGASWPSLVHPDDRDRSIAAHRRLARDGTPFAIDERCLRSDGSAVWVSESVTAVPRGDGRPEAAVVVVSDLGDRRRTEQAMRNAVGREQAQARTAELATETSRAELVHALVDNREARAEAVAASSAKDRFLAALSHELRTPLTPVVLAVHALKRSSGLSEQVRDTIELIRRNVATELGLIDDLLDASRISSGRLGLVRARIDMHEVVRAAASLCEAGFAARRQRLRLDLRATHAEVEGDAVRLRQVVGKLLDNASRFTHPDGEVRVATSSVADRFVLVVADTGIGIAAEALTAIFDAFAQEGPWVTSEFGGLGLGLAIARATVEAHHGTLVAASPGRNRGATFTIELPLGDAPARALA